MFVRRRLRSAPDKALAAAAAALQFRARFVFIVLLQVAVSAACRGAAVYDGDIFTWGGGLLMLRQAAMRGQRVLRYLVDVV